MHLSCPPGGTIHTVCEHIRPAPTDKRLQPVDADPRNHHPNQRSGVCRLRAPMEPGCTCPVAKPIAGNDLPHQTVGS